MPDELIPGTLLVGHALPVIAQALIFITVVEVNPTQMAILIAGCVAGGWVGAGVVASFSRRAIQFAMGGALSAAAVLMLIGMSGLIPGGRYRHDVSAAGLCDRRGRLSCLARC